MRSKLPKSRLPDFRASIGVSRPCTFERTTPPLCVHFRSNLSIYRLSCIHSCLCPDYRAFKVAYVQNIVRSKLPMSRLSCVQCCLCPDYRAFIVAYVQTNLRSNLLIYRLSCVQSCLSPDFRASIGVSRPCTFERTTPPLCVHFRLDMSTLGLAPQPGLVCLCSNLFVNLVTTRVIRHTTSVLPMHLTKHILKRIRVRQITDTNYIDNDLLKINKCDVRAFQF